ncbi:MAG: sensor histidine kinase [Chitinophagaceae bacterium]|nr:sensor histidine kinase [Chitinophagaceae bacterium]
MRRIVTCIICLFITFQCISQDLDSLRLRLTVMKEDTTKVLTYYACGDLFVQEAPDSAAFYYNKGKALAEKLDFKKGMAAYASHYIVLLNTRGEYNEALHLAKEALAIFQTLGDKKELSTAYLNVGSEWQYLSDFQQAAENYLEAKKLAEETGDLRTQRIANNNLAGIFLVLQQYQKGKEYAEVSLTIAKKINSDYAIASSLYNIAAAETYLKQYDTALIHFREVEEIGRRTNDYMFILDGWLGAAGAYSGLKKYAEAEKSYNEVLRLSREKEAVEYELYAHMGLADMLLNAGRYYAAGKPIQAGIAIAQKTGAKYELKDLYFKASTMEEKTGRPAEALASWKKFQQLNDSVINEKNKSDINLIDAKYEFEKKQNLIRQLEGETQIHRLAIRQKNMLNYALLGGAAILLVISLLYYRNYRQKQKIQQQRITELETEKKLSATEAVLKGEERERTRLAKDLHDGLGGILSGIKYSFQTMKGNLIMTPENQQAFERSMDMLDSSIKEMRRVAHNMMPEALVKFGLDTALSDICNDINQSGVLKITYQSNGLENVVIDQTTAITIYRIVQELINNTIKHAGASSAIVQIDKSEAGITLTVEDDGKGFDTVLLQQSKGIGWSNIQSRVEFLKGKLDVKSSAGKGTSVLIELKA